MVAFASGIWCFCLFCGFWCFCFDVLFYFDWFVVLLLVHLPILVCFGFVVVCLVALNLCGFVCCLRDLLVVCGFG